MHAPAVVENLRQVYLEMMLGIVVLLVLIVRSLAFAVGIFAARVVASAIFGHVLFRGIVPRHVSFFLATEYYETKHCAFILIGGLGKVAPQFRRGSLDITVRTHMAYTGIEAPVTAEHTRTEAKGLAIGIIHTVRSRYFGISVLRGRIGEHVDTCTERSGTVHTRSGAALYLHIAERRGKVGHIDPIYIMTLGIVDWHTVGCDIDTRAVGAAHTDRRISHACAGIGCRDDRWSHVKQKRDVVTVVEPW